MPTSLLLAHPDLKTQRHLWIEIAKVSVVKNCSKNHEISMSTFWLTFTIKRIFFAFWMPETSYFTKTTRATDFWMIFLEIDWDCKIRFIVFENDRKKKKNTDMSLAWICNFGQFLQNSDHSAVLRKMHQSLRTGMDGSKFIHIIKVLETSFDNVCICMVIVCSGPFQVFKFMSWK